MSVRGLPRLHFAPLKLLTFNAVPDPAFHTKADLDPASQNNADPCGTGSRFPTLTESWQLLRAVLRIHEILVRIRIRRSMPLTNESGSRSCYFRQWPLRRQHKIISVFAYYFLKVHLPSFKVIKKSQKTNRRNQCFSDCFCLILEGSGSEFVSVTNGSGAGRP